MGQISQRSRWQYAARNQSITPQERFLATNGLSMQEDMQASSPLKVILSLVKYLL